MTLTACLPSGGNFGFGPGPAGQPILWGLQPPWEALKFCPILKMKKGWGRIPEPRYPDRQPTDLLGSVVKNTESAFIVYICGGGGVAIMCCEKRNL